MRLHYIIYYDSILATQKMTFLNSWMLWALLAGTLPVIIHLINKWRHKSIKWAAMDFLLQAARERRGKKKLLQYLILALRTLAILALAAILSRPLIHSIMGWSGLGGGDVHVILDRSASMQALPHGDASISGMIPATLIGILKHPNCNRIVLQDSASNQFIDVESPDYIAELNITHPTDSGTSIPVQMMRAIDRFESAPTPQTELWIVSDLQGSNWELASPLWQSIRNRLATLPTTVTLRLISFSDAPSASRTLELKSAREENGHLLVDAIITRSSDMAEVVETILLSLNIDGSVQDIPTTLVGASTQIHKRVPLPKSYASSNKERGYGSLSLPTDDTPHDNMSYFAYRGTPSLRVALLSEDNDISTVLANMTAPAGLPYKKIVSLGKEINLLSTPLLLWQGELPGGERAKKLEQYIHDGGIVLFLPPLASANTPASRGGILQTTWDTLDTAPPSTFYQISTWDKQFDILRNSPDGSSIPVQQTHAIKRHLIKTKLKEGIVLTPIAAWNDGLPALSKIHHGKGVAYFMTTLPINTWSNLEDGYLLVPLLQRISDLASQRMFSHGGYQVGGNNLPVSTSYSPKRILPDTLGSPDLHAGIYALGDEIFAVNSPDMELDVTKVTDEQIKAILPDIQITHADTTTSTQQPISEIWLALAIMALLYLLIEALLTMPAKPVKEES